MDKATKIIIGVISLVLILLITNITIYAKYLNGNNFLFGTTINGIDVGGKDVNEVYRNLTTRLDKPIYLFNKNSDTDPEHIIDNAGSLQYTITKREIEHFLDINHNDYSKRTFNIHQNKNFKRAILSNVNVLNLNKHKTFGKSARVKRVKHKYIVVKMVPANRIDVAGLISAIVNTDMLTGDNNYYLQNYQIVNRKLVSNEAAHEKANKLNHKGVHH